MKIFRILGLSLTVLTSAGQIQAQEPAAAVPQIELGRVESGPSTFVISSTGALDVNQATITFYIATRSSGGGSETKSALVRTGKSKTVKAILNQLAHAFAKSGAQVQPGSLLTVIGHLDHGGELRVMSDVAGGVRFDYFTSTSETVTQVRFSPEQASVVNSMLQNYR